MADSYWWSRYGNFEPGEGVLPHMGQVVAHYRRQHGCKTQARFAIAADVTERTVIDWERLPMIESQERRIFLAKMLKIPPALLGLDWRLVYYQDNQGNHEAPVPPDHAIEIANEDSYYLYADALTLAWSLYYSGKIMSVADLFERRFNKLKKCVERAPAIEREAWLGLLCQYYVLAVQIARHRGTDEANKRDTLFLNGKGLKIAQEIEDQELQAALWSKYADIYLEQGYPTKARDAARRAIQLAEKIGTHTPLYGNIHLGAAPILLPETINDSKLLREVRRTEDKVLTIVRDHTVEPDRSFLHINLTGVHHERAKLFLDLHKFYPKLDYLKDAENEMKLAWESFTPEFAEWALYFHLTEARLYEVQREAERSAQSGIEALKVARAGNSKRKESEIVALHQDLQRLAPNNPYVCNLGVRLGMF